MARQHSMLFLLPVSPGKPLHQAFHLMFPIQTDLPHHYQHYKKHFKFYFLQEYDQYLVKLKEPQSARHKLQGTNKNIEKEGSLCMKSSTPEEFCAKGVFQIQLPISGINFSNNISIPHVT